MIGWTTSIVSSAVQAQYLTILYWIKWGTQAEMVNANKYIN